MISHIYQKHNVVSIYLRKVGNLHPFMIIFFWINGLGAYAHH